LQAQRKETTGGCGVTVLFFSPPGTGKTISAGILGNMLGIDVYCVDLSRVVSKYIGETEKNRDAIFTEALRAHCLMFFDETSSMGSSWGRGPRNCRNGELRRLRRWSMRPLDWASFLSSRALRFARGQAPRGICFSRSVTVFAGLGLTIGLILHCRQPNE